MTAEVKKILEEEYKSYVEECRREFGDRSNWKPMFFDRFCESSGITDETTATDLKWIFEYGL